MRGLILILVTVIVYIGTPAVIIWEWSIWWNAGETFWVFMSVFTGIGWIPAWFLGLWDLFALNGWLGVVYLGSVGYYLKEGFTE